MKNKRGFLLAEETLKIVIAVVCIGILIYFLASLYFSKINARELLEAENLLKEPGAGSMKAQLSLLNEGNSSSFHLKNPAGWYLFGFVKGTKPNTCVGQSCLCACEKVLFNNFLIWRDRQIKECDEDGVCLIIPTLKEFDPIEIRQQDITISRINNRVVIKQ